MPQFNEVKINRILNPTAIDLGEFVINPFMGCEFACLYCYVRSNRVISRKKDAWGEFVDVRVNAPELLEKELLAKNPKTVLLGSTTECFQPIESKYRLTGKILEILNRHKVRYNILTRSPLILKYIPLLKEGFCEKIYFTVNNYKDAFKMKLEPKSPSFTQRNETIHRLLEEGVPVVPYFSPVLPWVSEVEGVFENFNMADSVEFECLNFRLNNIKGIIDSIALVSPSLKARYESMLNDRVFYAGIWKEIKENIEIQAKSAKKRYNIYIHEFGDYFKNTYNIVQKSK